MNSGNWQIEVTAGLAAHFKQPNGTSSPGYDWAVEFKNGTEIRKLLVRQYVKNNGSGVHTKALTNQVMQFVTAKLDSGWFPEASSTDLIIMNTPQLPPENLNPTTPSHSATNNNPPTQAKVKPWWKIW